MPNGIAVTRMMPRNSKPENTWPIAGIGTEKPKWVKAPRDLVEAHAADIEAEQRRAPGDQHARRDRDQARRNALRILHAAEPAHQDDGEADQSDLRRHEHFQRRAHGDEGDRHARKRAKQRRARRDLADIGRDEAADHQDEALEEHPDEARFPALDRIVGRSVIGSMITNVTTNMCGTLTPDGSAQTSVRPVFCASR